jgi:cytochrome c-type biogenesis protein CcmH
MTVFLIVVVLVAVVSAALSVAPLLFGRSAARARDALDAAVFRDQLAEIDRDLARGTITAAEATGARAEISRRLIAATARAERSGALTPAPRVVSLILAGVVAVGLPVLATVVYVFTGAPGLPDSPFAARTPQQQLMAVQGETPGRPSQAQAEAQRALTAADAPPPETEPGYTDLVARLEALIADRPSDIEGRRLLVTSYLRLQRFAEAWRVQEEIIALEGPRATGDMVARQAEAMVLAADGYVSPEAERVIDRALSLDPATPMARYYDGLRLAQGGQLPQAVDVWRRLRADAPGNAPWRPWLDNMLAEGERLLAARPAAPGPDAAAVAASQDMTPEERMEMIGGMVGRLEARLAEGNGTPEEWFRLINAYAVLGDMAEARRAYGLSQRALTGSEASFVREQALLIGVVEQ